MGELTHIDDKGMPRMVDVSEKAVTRRMAKAYGKVLISEKVYNVLMGGGGKKGRILETAKIAGIMGAKNTSLLIPLSHPLPIEHIDIDFAVSPSAIEIMSSVKYEGKTGVEMEAITAVVVASLTIYDMCKAIDKGIVITDVKLIEKSGGKSGLYKVEGDYEKAFK
jgi:cyclic pyranopterin phosphate synthase